MSRWWILLSFLLGAVASFFATRHYFQRSEPTPPLEKNQVDSASLDIQFHLGVPALAQKPKDPVLEYRELRVLEANSEICNRWRALSQRTDWAPSKIATLQMILRCPENPERDLSFIQEPWLQPLKLKAELKLAEASGTLDIHVKALVQMAPSLRTSRERVEVLERAHQLALKLPSGTLAEEVWQHLEKAAPRLRKSPKPEDLVAVAQDWIGQRQFEKGRDILRRIANDKKRPWEERRRAHQSIRNSYKTEQNKKVHLDWSKIHYTWLKTNKDLKSAVDAGFYYARALWTEGRKTEAQKIFRELEKNKLAAGRLFEIDFILGRMAEEDGDFKKAAEFFDKALERGAKKTSTGVKASFAKAWALMRLQEFEKSASAFQLSAEEATEFPDQIKARFWQARTVQKSGAKEEAETLFRQVVTEDPLGFYGLMAQRDLGGDLPPFKAAQEAAVLSLDSSVLESNQRQWIQDLSQMEEREILRDFLDDLTSHPEWNWDSGSALEVLKAYGKAGLYLPLFAALNKLEKETREALLLKYPELLFPRDYANLIEKAAGREGLPPELIFSIIRQESAFDPNARSWADALGLMQILPSAAKKIAGSLQLKFEHFEDLYKPEFNIPVGTHLLKQNFQRYKGNFILAVASYNANDRAIRGWLNTRFREDPLEFIEEIPYEETRSYVKLVMRNFVFYRRLAQPEKPLAFPSECLPSLLPFKSSTVVEAVAN